MHISEDYSKRKRDFFLQIKWLEKFPKIPKEKRGRDDSLPLILSN